MWVRVKILADGHGPSEKLVGIKTNTGKIEQVLISRRVLKGKSIDVGLVLSQDGDDYLIELPRESISGKWRIWVSATEIESDAMQAAE